MIAPLARLGAFFGLPGYFAHERKARQRQDFKHVPPDRLLIVTDAPDPPLPDMPIAEAGMQKVLRRVEVYPLAMGVGGKPLNPPANLRAVSEFASEWLQKARPALAARVEENFLRLFGGR